MGKTSAEDLTRILLEGFNPLYYDGLHRARCRAFGDAIQKDGGVRVGSGGRFPDYAYISLKMEEVGISHRILNTQFLMLSRIMRADPEPEFPDLPKPMGETLKQFFLTRARQGQWLDQHVATFLDGDGLGLGLTLVGKETNPETKKNRVTLKNVPALRFAYDWHSPKFTNARWCMVMNYLPKEEAIAQYGSKVKNYETIQLSQNSGGEPLPVIRMFEVWTKGLGKDDPIYAIIPGDFVNEPLSIEPNPWNAELPVAHYEHLLRPGFQRPTGRISTLGYLEESINNVERALIEESKVAGFRITTDAIDQDDLDRINQGDRGVIAKMNRPLTQGEEPFHNVPAGEVGSDNLELMNILERNFNANSGINDFDMGNLSQQKRTLGENQLLDQRSKVQSNWSVMALARYYERVVEKVLHVAGLIDDDPVAINLFGKQIPLNQPQMPASSITAFTANKSRIIVAEDSLMKADLQQERMDNIAKLQPLAPLVTAGVIPIPWYAEEVVESAGYDPQEVFGQSGAQAPQQQGQSAQDKLVETMAFKDLPPAGQIQLAAKAGIQLKPEDFPKDTTQKAPDKTGKKQPA